MFPWSSRRRTESGFSWVTRTKDVKRTRRLLQNRLGRSNEEEKREDCGSASVHHETVCICTLLKMLIVTDANRPTILLCSLVHHDGGGSASFASFIFTHPGNKQKKNTHTRKRAKPIFRRMTRMFSFPSNLLTPANTRSCMSQPPLSPSGTTLSTPPRCQQQLSCPDGRKMWKLGCIAAVTFTVNFNGWWF